MGKDKYIPHLLGHEGSGVVLDVAKNVKHLKKNDHVVRIRCRIEMEKMQILLFTDIKTKKKHQLRKNYDFFRV